MMQPVEPNANARRFGRYQLVSRLGKGGMAEVWRAQDPTGRTMVVKRMLADLTESDEAVDMFRNEARVSTRLNHPGIVRVFEAGEVEGEPFLAMELLDGRNLNQVLFELAQLGHPPVGFAVLVAREMCRALSYVHSLTDERGEFLRLLHRDVSPANVMVCFDGSVKLCDFGIAKALNDAARQRTQVGVLKGKLGYLSPEAVDGREVDHRSDLFAAGIVLHEMLTARRLFRGTNDLETLQRVLDANVAPPSTLNPAVPPELDRIVMKALARDREQRYATCRDLAVELDLVVEKMGWSEVEVARLMKNLFAHVPAPAPVEAPPTPTPSTVGRWRRRTSARWARTAAVAVLGLMATIGGVTGWRVAHGGRADASPRPIALRPAFVTPSPRVTSLAAARLRVTPLPAVPETLATVGPLPIAASPPPHHVLRVRRAAHKPIPAAATAPAPTGRIGIEDVF